MGVRNRSDDGLGVRINYIRCLHHVLDIFKFDCWWRSIGENGMARGSVDSSTINLMLLERPLGAVG